MALITSYSSGNDSNKAIETALQVTYSRRRVYGQWTYVQNNVETTVTRAWAYSRRAVKSYRYGGFDLAAALACRAAMVALYTRSVKASEFSTSGGTIGSFVTDDAGEQLMAEVSVQHEGGAMYSVVVNVNEQDERTTTIPDASFATLFSAEMARDYDGESETT